jgi:hypothetical protein
MLEGEAMNHSLAFVFPTTTTVVGWILFGSIGTVAVGYAKLKEEWLYAILGFALMVYPYFFPSGFGLWLMGAVLTVLLFMPRWFLNR